MQGIGMEQITALGTIRSKWGEGPVFHRDRLYYVDIEGHKVVALDPVGGGEQCWEVGQRVGCALPRQAGGWLCAGDHGFFFLDELSGTTKALADPEAHLPANRFNDGKCAPDGFAFAGSISLNKTTGSASLYRMAPDRTVTVAFRGVTNSNGMAWSLDGKTLYYIDTPRREVLCFDYAAGELHNPRTAFATTAVEGSPDGMTIDVDGRLWIAFCHGGCVACWDATSGQLLQRIALPCLETTSVAFGGADYATLFVTTGLHPRVEEPLAGRILAINGTGSRGLPPHCFAG